jgi:hypothetical protein
VSESVLMSSDGSAMLDICPPWLEPGG